MTTSAEGYRADEAASPRSATTGSSPGPSDLRATRSSGGPPGSSSPPAATTISTPHDRATPAQNSPRPIRPSSSPMRMTSRSGPPLDDQFLQHLQVCRQALHRPTEPRRTSSHRRFPQRLDGGVSSPSSATGTGWAARPAGPAGHASRQRRRRASAADRVRLAAFVAIAPMKWIGWSRPTSERPRSALGTGRRRRNRRCFDVRPRPRRSSWCRRGPGGTRLPPASRRHGRLAASITDASSTQP